MPITKTINTLANVKQLTGADSPQNPAVPVTLTYGPATSTAGQTVINLGFAVPTSNTSNFFIWLDGKLLSLGSSNDYTFTNVQANGTSSQVTLNASIVAGLNINAVYMGILVPSTASTSILTINATIASQPTVQKFLSGSGTYTTPAGVKYIRVRMVGGGGGGGGGGVLGSSGSGGGGGTTTFGSSLLTCTGGGAGSASGTAPTASGGTATLNSPALGLAINGGSGNGGSNGSTNAALAGGPGAPGPFGGGGGPGEAGQNGGSGATNSGSGGGGGGVQAVASGDSGNGAGAGAFIDALITSPSTTYAYAVGVGGTNGTAGTSGNPGGAGGSGVVIVEEFYV